MPDKRISAATLLAVLLAAPQSARAAEQKFSGEYVVSYLGLTVARTTFRSAVGPDSFRLDGTLRSAGVAQLFDDTRGTVSATGGFAGESTRPVAYHVDYTSGKKAATTDIAFSGGAVTKAVNQPPPKPKDARWVPVAPSDLKNVTDPMSATLVKASAPGTVCGRTVPVFDGEFRFDLVLSPAPDSTVTVDGTDVSAVTCNARVRLVSGYNRGRKALEFLEKQSRITIAFAPLGDTGVYAPIHASIGTQIGTLTVKARRIKAQ